jgi:hypothetical protein
MWRDADNASGEPCVDEVTLQAFSDGELDEARSEVILHHVSTCRACARVLARLCAVGTIAAQELAGADAGVGSADVASVGRVEARLGSAFAARRSGRSGWVAAAFGAVALLLLLTVPSFNPAAGASAERILTETILRERAWATQPGRVLHWVIESETHSLREPDGRHRVLCWQANGLGDESAYLVRDHDAQGALWSAYWRRTDGSEIRWRRDRQDEVVMIPPTTGLREALPGLSPYLQRGLTAYLALRDVKGSPALETRSFAEDLRHATDPANRESTVQRVHQPGWGDLFHVRTDRRIPEASDGLLRIASDDYIGVADFRRYRLHLARYYADGRVETEDSRWAYFPDTPPADFTANTLEDVIDRAARVVTWSPEDAALEGLRIKRLPLPAGSRPPWRPAPGRPAPGQPSR